jgi:hypothetical protein
LVLSEPSDGQRRRVHRLVHSITNMIRNIHMETRIIHITAAQAAEMHRASQPVRLTKKQIIKEGLDWLAFALFMYVLLWHGLAL